MAEDKTSLVDDMLDKPDAELKMDDINLTDGCNPSPYFSGCGSGRLIQQREKFEERNKIMLEKKIEDIRIKKKLEEAIEKDKNNLKRKE